MLMLEAKTVGLFLSPYGNLKKYMKRCNSKLINIIFLRIISSGLSSLCSINSTHLVSSWVKPGTVYFVLSHLSFSTAMQGSC